MPLNRQARTCASPPGGRAKIENSSRRHPRKFGQKRFLAVRRSWRGKWGGLFLGYLLGRNYRRRDRDHLVPPRRMDAAVCRAEVCYPSGWKHGRHWPLKRREFITLVGGTAAAWPLAARAQQTTMPVVGYLRSGSRGASSQVEAGFRQGLSSIGFIEGRNVAIDYQYAENQNDRLMALTADLVHQPMAVIYAGDNITAVMVKAATTTIPVVFRIGGDPIQLGLVTSLSRPDGNMTGVSFLSTATGAIRLQMMREAVPNAAVIGLLVNPANPNAELDTQEAQNAARKLGLELHVV